MARTNTNLIIFWVSFEALRLSTLDYQYLGYVLEENCQHFKVDLTFFQSSCFVFSNIWNSFFGTIKVEFITKRKSVFIVKPILSLSSKKVTWAFSKMTYWSRQTMQPTPTSWFFILKQSLADGNNLIMNFKQFELKRIV